MLFSAARVIARELYKRCKDIGTQYVVYIAAEKATLGNLAVAQYA